MMTYSSISDTDSGFGVYIYWIPLGAGGTGFVALNGRIYEAFVANRERRRRLEILHTALLVSVPRGKFIIETMWPSPGGDPTSRGVRVEGPVFATFVGRSHVFRYEVRCWENGVLRDAGSAIDGPVRLTSDTVSAERLLGLVDATPALTWGRDELSVGEMWNSNSVVAYLLAGAGVDMDDIVPPSGTKAPGWGAGIAAAALFGIRTSRSRQAGTPQSRGLSNT